MEVSSKERRGTWEFCFRLCGTRFIGEGMEKDPVGTAPMRLELGVEQDRVLKAESHESHRNTKLDLDVCRISCLGGAQRVPLMKQKAGAVHRSEIKPPICDENTVSYHIAWQQEVCRRLRHTSGV